MIIIVTIDYDYRNYNKHVFSKISHNRTTIIDFSAIHWYNDYYDFLETLLQKHYYIMFFKYIMIKHYRNTIIEKSIEILL